MKSLLRQLIITTFMLFYSAVTDFAQGDEQGNFLITSLPVGVYRVEAEQSGFKRYDDVLKG